MTTDTTSWGLLQWSLAANAVFSGVSGVALLIGSIPLSGWLGIPVWMSLLLGFGLVGFALTVAVTARRPTEAGVRSVIFADLAWVAGAGVVIVGFPESMSTAGLWILGLVTVTVADFAALQFLGMRRHNAGALER